MSAYYNEIDPFAAAWLRELIKAGHIPPGDVDERSIEDVSADDVRPYRQAHFFAGIGGWSYALRRAGWADTDAVWTGSCPCQSFSASGQGRGFDDTRHLWPAWQRLISECRPNAIFGEQVASPAGLAWFDVVSTDLEDAGYTVGAADLCAAGVGAPHIRQRLYFVAESENVKRWSDVGRECRRNWAHSGRTEAHGVTGTCGEVRGVADNHGGRCGEHGAAHDDNGRHASRHDAARCGADGVLADTDDSGPQRRRFPELPKRTDECVVGPTGPSGFWDGCDWLPCQDGKLRPTQPGLFPLATGVSGRVGRLRGYGNAINAPLAQAFIEAYMSLEASA